MWFVLLVVAGSCFVAALLLCPLHRCRFSSHRTPSEYITYVGPKSDLLAYVHSQFQIFISLNTSAPPHLLLNTYSSARLPLHTSTPPHSCLFTAIRPRTYVGLQSVLLRMLTLLHIYLSLNPTTPLNVCSFTHLPLHISTPPHTHTVARPHDHPFTSTYTYGPCILHADTEL